MPAFVYLLCAVTSLLCCGLLWRAHRRAPGSLLSHSALAFLCFAAANILLFVDLILWREADLRFLRDLVSLAGVVVLLAGLINHQGRSIR